MSPPGPGERRGQRPANTGTGAGEATTAASACCPSPLLPTPARSSQLSTAPPDSFPASHWTRGPGAGFQAPRTACHPLSCKGGGGHRVELHLSGSKVSGELCLCLVLVAPTPPVAPTRDVMRGFPLAPANRRFNPRVPCPPSGKPVHRPELGPTGRTAHLARGRPQEGQAPLPPVGDAGSQAWGFHAWGCRVFSRIHTMTRNLITHSDRSKFQLMRSRETDSFWETKIRRNRAALCWKGPT